MRRATCGLVLMLLWTAPAAADPGADVAELVALRNGLAARLEARHTRDAEAGPCGDLHLVLPGAADHEEMPLTLRRRGGTWVTARAQVPAWDQATMKEWRGFHVGNRTGCMWKPALAFPVEPALAWEDTRLEGTLDVALRLDLPRDERLLPDRDNGWWGRFIPGGYTEPRPTRLAIDARVDPDAWWVDLVLDGGLRWDPATTGHKKHKGVMVRPIVIRMEVPATRFTHVECLTPTWNQGFHEADATGLRLEPSGQGRTRLRGELVVSLHQDGWMPWGGGKTWQHPPLVLRFTLDAALDGDRVGANGVGGSFQVEGDMGRYKGTVLGRAGPMVRGRYRATGALGTCEGPVRGMALSGPGLVEPHLVKEPGGMGDAAFADALLHEVRALALALRHPGLPYIDAFAQTDGPAPDWPRPVDEAQLAAYVSEALALCRAAVAAEAAPPEAAPVAAGGVPAVGTAPAPATEEGINRLPEAAGWHYLTRWQVLGPFEQRLGLEHHTGRVPDLVPVEGLSYRQDPDTFRAAAGEANTRAWQAVKADSDRVAPAGQKASFYRRFLGEVWYATARLEAPADTTLHLALASADGARVWIDGRLVWADPEKVTRYRPRGRDHVAVPLAKGTHRVLVRFERDRRPGWVRLALATRRPDGPTGDGPPEPPTEAVAGPHAFPDADPPLAWDLDAGTNVAWRSEALGGRTRPVIAGDRLYATRGLALHCADPASGAGLWTRDAWALASLGEAAATAWASSGDEEARCKALSEAVPGLRVKRPSDLAAEAPVADTRHVWVHSGVGTLACFDRGGERRWTLRTHLGGARVHKVGGRLIVEGETLDSWPQDKDEADAKGRKKKGGRRVGLLLVDAEDGKEIGRWTVPGRFHGPFSRLVPVGGSLALHTSWGGWLDPASGTLSPPVDHEPLDHGGPASGASGYGGGLGHALAAAPGWLVQTTQEQAVALRLWRLPGGRIAGAPAWASNYEHAGFGSFVAPSVVAGGRLFSYMPVLDRGPHCPDPRTELHVQDLATGRPRALLKPALERAVIHDPTPVVAGGYVFATDPGGGTHGGHETHGQCVIATADARLDLVCRNLIEKGTRASPVFREDRLLLRSPASLTCVAVTGDAGRAYQARRLAETLMEAIGPAAGPVDAETAEPLAEAPPDPAAPVQRLRDGRAPGRWLALGPAKPDALPDEAARGLGLVKAGDTVPFGGGSLQAVALGPETAWREPPRYHREHSLQGTGDILPTLTNRVDPAACFGPKTAGLLYTIVDVPRACLVEAGDGLLRPGVTAWLGGVRLAKGAAVRLKPGLVPLVVRVGPDYYASLPAAPAGGEEASAGAARGFIPALKAVPPRAACWRDRAAARRADLEAAARDAAGTEAGAAAKQALAALGG